MMPQYRKKPVVINAFRLGRHFPDNPDNGWFVEAITEGVVKTFNMGSIPENPEQEPYILIETLEGTMKGKLGDYIIQGVKGEIYACEPNIFNLTYEMVDYV